MGKAGGVEAAWEGLQERLGYQFADGGLLRCALTHRSFGSGHNERLEYLGDSILGFVVAEMLFEAFPRASEAELSMMRARLVCNKTLSGLARDLEMQGCVRVGKAVRKGMSVTAGGTAAETAAGAMKASILADALEALVGAVYLDSEMGTARAVVRKLFAVPMGEISPINCKDEKTRLQEYLQARGGEVPRYELVERVGEDHAPTFTMVCRFGSPAGAAGEELEFKGSAGSRQGAEQAAARDALAFLGDG